MNLTTLAAAGLEGVDGYLVTVEVHRAEPSSGIGRTTVVGLPDAAVRESIDRVTPALFSSRAAHRPTDHLVVNLAPADRRKEGPAFDLAIAVGLAATMEENTIPTVDKNILYCAELALDGSLRPVRGILAMVQAARDAGCHQAVVAPADVAEASLVHGISIAAPATFDDVIVALQQQDWSPHLGSGDELNDLMEDLGPDLADVRGQAHAKRALAIAAAGGHNLLMIGPPGSGKTMLARRLPGLLPPLDDDEALDVTRIHSVAGLRHGDRGLLRQRPFRAPHHNVSGVGLVGGGSVPRPGEVSLAHHGVLFLDELPEFPRPVLESLRQPLEDGHLTISRAGGRLNFPAACTLIAAMNPCPCGYLGHPTRACSCSQDRIQRYRSRISGPLVDRIDIHLDVPAQRPEQLNTPIDPESRTAFIRQQVLAARQRMLDRQGCANAALGPGELREHGQPTPTALLLLHQAIDDLGLSARAHDRILRVARTIADLDDRECADVDHISEAIGYRLLDRQVW